MPSRNDVPGAIISNAFINPGSGLASVSKSSPDRRGTVTHFRAFPLVKPLPAWTSVHRRNPARTAADHPRAGFGSLEAPG